MANFKVPELREFPIIPIPKDGVTSHLSPFVAKPEFQEALNYPGKKTQEEGKDPKYVFVEGFFFPAIN